MKINKKLRIIARIYRALLAFYCPKFYYPLFCLCLVISLIGCTKDEDEADFSDSPAPPPIVEENSIKSEETESPQRTVRFTINDNPTAVQLVASSPGVEIRLVKLSDPNGSVLFSSDRLQDRTISHASEFQSSPLTYNYPMLAGQPPLSPGEYSAVYETRDQSSFDFTGAEVSLDVITKNDNDLENGLLNLNIILSGVVINTKDIRDGIEDSVDILGIILERYGIKIFANIIPLPESPEILPSPVDGDPIYEEASKEAGNGINIFIANNLQSFNSRAYNSAIAGSSPGAIIPSPRSAIAVDLSVATGQDGLFNASQSGNDNTDSIDDSETRLLAESLAHEILAYMGLKDSVTFGSNQVTSTDGLDSEKCTNIQSCEDNKGANGNIMFPFPLRMDETSSGEKYFPRDRLSPQQAEIAQRYVGID